MNDLESRAGGGGGGRGRPRPRPRPRPEGGGGGGGEGGGGGGGGGGSGGSGGNSGGSSGRGSSISVGGTSKPVLSGGRGGGPTTTIPPGQPFSGRTQGGGTRDQIYGTRHYGSGYPGVSGRGVAGHNLPFYFWPVTWGGVAGFGTAAYLDATDEYGSPDNTTRPGGPLYATALTSTNSTFRLLADNTTVTSLITDIISSCNSSLSSPSSITASPYPNTGPPVPEQAVQYYRASSVALTLDGYNNTAVFSEDENAPDTPLPANTDMGLLNCLNATIGRSVPLVEAENATTTVNTVPPTAVIMPNSSRCLEIPSAANLGLLLLVWKMLLLVVRSNM